MSYSQLPPKILGEASVIEAEDTYSARSLFLHNFEEVHPSDLLGKPPFFLFELEDLAKLCFGSDGLVHFVRFVIIFFRAAIQRKNDKPMVCKEK